MNETLESGYFNRKTRSQGIDTLSSLSRRKKSKDTPYFPKTYTFYVTQSATGVPEYKILQLTIPPVRTFNFTNTRFSDRVKESLLLIKSYLLPSLLH